MTAIKSIKYYKALIKELKIKVSQSPFESNDYFKLMKQLIGTNDDYIQYLESL